MPNEKPEQHVKPCAMRKQQFASPAGLRSSFLTSFFLLVVCYQPVRSLKFCTKRSPLTVCMLFKHNRVNIQDAVVR